MTRFALSFIGTFAAVTISIAKTHAAQSAVALPSDGEIRKIIAERVDALAGKDDGIGIVVGIIGSGGRRIISYGHFDQGDPRSLAGDTVFEIGSVTKGFTALLLADMVQKGEVALTDPVAKYLPAGKKLPERNGRSITFLDLATHTSGLPFMLDALPASGDSQYSDANLYKFLSGYTLQRDIGSKWEYSNVGYWLLSQALSARGGAKFEDLLLARVIAPLKLKHTAFNLSPEIKELLAPGHDASLQPAPITSANPMYGTMPAAGLLYSTADDLLTVMSAAMGYEPSPLVPAIANTVKSRRPTSEPGYAQALGWTIIGEGNDELIFRDGGTFGYASAMVWDPVNRVGAAVLSNHVESVADIARHLLRPDFPLKKPMVTKHNEVSLDTATLARYAGRYEAAGEGIFEIKLEGSFLTFRAPGDWGLPKMRLHPESSLDFFAAELPLRVTVQNDGDGNVNGLLIHPPRGEKAVPAKRISSDEKSK